ncbi:hypothetical protein DAMO_0858 [Candidatus Methylomirabilis oxygeniifera]|uniref:Uncharacterized protein n=1 Tax=Methylomirabilis oxygeniifera TaxID=671143 RepID=D5MM33_METO1|nr:hypothetical protein DAMO_0858 [Candidatus Methylomirabilis oxyfera]
MLYRSALIPPSPRAFRSPIASTSHAYGVATQRVQALSLRIVWTGRDAGVDTHPSAAVAGCMDGSRGGIVWRHARINQDGFSIEVVVCGGSLKSRPNRACRR